MKINSLPRFIVIAKEGASSKELNDTIHKSNKINAFLILPKTGFVIYQYNHEKDIYEEMK